MLDDSAISARYFISVGALIYMGAFLFGMVRLLLNKTYQRATMYTLLLCGFVFQLIGHPNGPSLLW